jgi:hypothetical protein
MGPRLLNNRGKNQCEDEIIWFGKPWGKLENVYIKIVGKTKDNMAGKKGKIQNEVKERKIMLVK